MIEQAKQAAGVSKAGALPGAAVMAMSVEVLPRGLRPAATMPVTFHDTLRANSGITFDNVSSEALMKHAPGGAVQSPAAKRPLREPLTKSSSTSPGLTLIAENLAARSGFGSSTKLATPTNATLTAPQLPVLAQPVQLPVPSQSAPLLHMATLPKRSEFTTEPLEVKMPFVATASPVSKGTQKVEREKRSSGVEKARADRWRNSIRPNESVDAIPVEISGEITPLNQNVDAHLRTYTQTVAQVGGGPAEGVSKAPAIVPVSMATQKKPLSMFTEPVLSSAQQTAHELNKVVPTAAETMGERESSAHTGAPLAIVQVDGVSATNLSTKDHGLAHAVLVSGTTAMHVSAPRTDENAGFGSSTLATTVPRSSAPIDVEPTGMKTLLATSHVLEIGVGDGTHGWLRVRAELGHTGEVMASVVAATAGAAEKLHRELPEMFAYLRSEQVGVSSLVVHATAKTSGTPEQTIGMSAGTDAQSNSQRSREGGSGATESEPSSDRTGSLPEPIESGGVLNSMLANKGRTPALTADGSGGWLDVRV